MTQTLFYSPKPRWPLLHQSQIMHVQSPTWLQGQHEAFTEQESPECFHPSLLILFVYSWSFCPLDAYSPSPLPFLSSPLAPVMMLQCIAVSCVAKAFVCSGCSIVTSSVTARWRDTCAPSVGKASTTPLIWKDMSGPILVRTSSPVACRWFWVVGGEGGVIGQGWGKGESNPARQ